LKVLMKPNLKDFCYLQSYDLKRQDCVQFHYAQIAILYRDPPTGKILKLKFALFNT
jgi:hypothetical protein